MRNIWNNTSREMRMAVIGFCITCILVVGGALAYNASQGLPLDGAVPPAMIRSRVALAVICPASNVTVEHIGAHNDKRLEVGRNALSPIKGVACEGQAPHGVVRIHSCEKGGAICLVNGELQAGVSALRVVDGVVVSADVYLHGPLDPNICPRPPGVEATNEACTMDKTTAFARLLDHELLHVDGAGVTKDGELRHATGATHIMSDMRGPSWRWLEVE